MIAYPIINFVLPLMLSSFILVDNPSRCSECQNKTEHKVAGNAVIDRILEFDTEVNSGESSVVTYGKGCKEQDTHRCRLKTFCLCEEGSSIKAVIFKTAPNLRINP